MVEKKEARALPNNTGNIKVSGKNTKRKRINRFELVFKRGTPVGVLNLKGGLL